MSMSPTFRKRQAGLSLLEVLVSALVLSAGLLGLASLQIAGMKTTHNSHQMQQATWLVNDLLEQMRANRVAAANGDYNVNGAPDCSVGAPDCSSGTCSATNLAAYDLFRIRCGDGVSVRNSLINGVLTVTCADPADVTSCNTGVTVGLQWDERNSSSKAADLDGNNDGLESFNINLTAVL